jgi:surface carbohydrate biosynthesis protein
VFYTKHDGTPVYWEVLFEAEVKVLDLLDKWCVKNNKLLKICGREKEENGPERDFYANHLIGCEWEYIPRKDYYSSYELINSAEIVVFIDSTLGYEAIGRGKKTASLSCRMISPFEHAYLFGWPADIPNNGPFWSNDLDQAQFQRVMDYLNSVSEEDWEQVLKRYASELMVFDPGNSCFVGLLDELLN